ncbi:TIM-barrel domain-containing protein [Caulobacter endophyticus]|uniref:TIM-barrel domain-containing protein n=1 Tax=Caulobacter endophyticus TaxID=2172652 RepID=UPI002410514F|nr:TIM-barrel domain-containing protein [Caulobacter endophyticus]MDG2529114.1 glycoside hydrolase family 31 protein [Caulobacter endophyticus]
MRSIYRGRGLAAGLALALLATTSAFALDGGFEKTADGVVVTPASGPAKKVRLQVMGERIIHVTASPTDTFDAPPSLMVTAKPVTGGFTVDEKGGVLTLKTAKATAQVSLKDGTVDFLDAKGAKVLAERDRGAFTPVKVEGQDFYSVRQQFNPGTDEAFYGLGQHQNGQMNYNGRDVELLQYNRAIAVPMLLSSRGYGLLWDNNSITRFGNPIPYDVASRDLKIFDADGKAGGFTAKYYQNGQLKVTRVEKDIDYRFLKDLPNWPAELQDAAKKNLPGQTVTWEGFVQTDKAGEHNFKLYSSGYAKVWLDGQLVIDRWRQNWNPWYHNFDAKLTPGKKHKVRVEWTPDDGYIGLLHNDPMPALDRHSLQLTSEVGKAIDYYYIGGDDLDQVVSGYRDLTGSAVMMPRWVYGFWQSRQRYETQDQIVGVVKEYRKRGLPLDNIVMDWRYWKDPEWGTHKFDETRFPSPQKMVDDIHGMNAHFMISIWPKFYPTTDNFKELDAKGHMYKRNIERGALDWVGPGYLNSFYDPYSQEARDIYWKQVKRDLKVYGVDAWWMDASEPDLHSNVDVPERTLRMSPTALGPGAEYFNSYALEHTRGVYEGEIKDNPDVRPFILTRSGFGGLQRNASAVWSGDVVARWDDFRDQISAGVNLSMSGIPNWTTDIGGFSVEKRYETKDPAHWAEWQELNLRWFQFGAFSPLFRSHGELPFREIYELADEGSDIYKSLAWYDELRYRLMPYVYTLAADTYHRDGSMMRGLVMDYPNDAKARNVDDQYLFGQDFLVAPVTAFKARSRGVYLPAGTWYDFETGKAFKGGQTVKADAPLARMPLFVKAGAIVPTTVVQQYVGEKPDAPITLLVFTGKDGKYELYEDDGLSNGYARGAWARTPISYDDATGRVTIGARSGSFKGMVEKRTFKVRFIGKGARPTDFDAAADLTVEYDGQPVALTRK